MFVLQKGRATLDVSSKSCEVGAIRVECLFTKFLVEHNLLLSVRDHARAVVSENVPEVRGREAVRVPMYENNYHRQGNGCKRRKYNGGGCETPCFCNGSG